MIYLSAGDLFEVFSRNKFDYDTPEDMRDTYRYILDCDLLIIDDLERSSITALPLRSFFTASMSV